MLRTRFFCLGRGTPLHCEGVTSGRSHTGSNLVTNPFFWSLSNGPCEAQPPQELGLKELNHSLITTSRPLHGTIYHSTAGGTVQSTFCTLTWPGLAKWSRGARWDVFHPWCSASRTEKCLRNATPQIYTPQSKMGRGRALLSAMPATSSRWEAVHRREHPGAVPSCAQVCTLLITPGRAKEA